MPKTEKGMFRDTSTFLGKLQGRWPRARGHYYLYGSHDA